MLPTRLLFQNLRNLVFEVVPIEWHSVIHRTRYHFFSNSAEKRRWDDRAEVILSSPDAQCVPRCREAGRVEDDVLILHNGIRVLADSYYGHFGRQLFRKTAGLHEPQEEKVFAETLKHVPRGATMIELGAYWAFYSLWFQQAIPDAVSFLVEPDVRNLAYGKKNFELNGRTGDFSHAYVDAKSAIAPDGVKILCVDDLVKEKRIEHVHVLHSDIQGYELAMLEGASRTFSEGRVSYCFISTHSPELHRDCREFLKSRNFRIFADVDLTETYSVDGLIAASAPSISLPPEIPLSRRSQEGQALQPR